MSSLLVLLVGSGSYLLVLAALTDTRNLNYVPSLLLLGSTVVPAATLTFAATHGPTAPPVTLLAATAFFGGVLGTVAAGLLEYRVLQQLDALPMLAVGLIAESSKLIVPVITLLVARGRWRDAGTVIGVASGMGFASMETMGYGLNALVTTHSIADLDQTLLLRGLLSPACHIAWTGIATTFLWQIRYPPKRGCATPKLSENPRASEPCPLHAKHKDRHLAVRFSRFIAAFLAVVGLHAIWDSTNLVAVHVLVAAMSLLGSFLLIRRDNAPTGGNPVGEPERHAPPRSEN